MSQDMPTETKRFESYVIQEMPERDGCFVWLQAKMTRSVITGTEEVKFERYITEAPYIVKTIWLAWLHEDPINQPFENLSRAFFARMKNVSRVDIVVAKLDRDSYLPIDSDGTKFDTMLLSCALYGSENGKDVPIGTLGIPDLMQMSAMAGWAPPMTMQIPLSVIHLLNDGKVDEAMSALSWLKEKPGQLMVADKRPTYVLRDLAAGCASYAISREYEIK